MAAERVLTEPELNRALLARQLLLDRARTPLPRALERIGGLQAQYAPSMYVGAWTRLAGFARGDLTRALERRSVVQATLMRSTIHLVSRADYWPIALAVREARRAAWVRARRNAFPPADMARAAAVVRGALERAPQRALRRAEAEALVGRDRAPGVGLWVDLVRVPPSGTWERRRADLLALAEDWVGPPPAGAPDGVELLVRRRLAGFGPATAAEVADWAGLPVAAVSAATERLALRRFRAADGAELLDVPRAPLPAGDAPAPVRFLPTYDATLLVHARRAGVLPEEHRARIFTTKMPQSVGTFLVDGRVAGTWRPDGERIAVGPFARLDAADARAVAEEADRLADLHAA